MEARSKVKGIRPSRDDDDDDDDDDEERVVTGGQDADIDSLDDDDDVKPQRGSGRRAPSCTIGHYTSEVESPISRVVVVAGRVGVASGGIARISQRRFPTWIVEVGHGLWPQRRQQRQ